MKLIGNLKKQVEQTESRKEAKKVIEQTGMELTDDELNKVAGGGELSLRDIQSMLNQDKALI